MSRELLDRLEEWKGRFDPAQANRLEALLARVASARFADAASLIRLHETLLFLRAYPLSPQVAGAADAILFAFGERVAAVDDPEPLEEPEVSGIVGTSLTAVFSCEVARRLVEHHKDCVEIGWDRYDEQDRLGPYVSRILPMMREDWPVEAHTPFQQWIAAAHPRRESDLQWLLANVDSAASYDAMQVPVTWRMGASRVSRSRLRLNSGRLFLHREPLLRRSDISLERVLAAAPLPVKRVPRPAARRILDLIVDTSAMRYRELYGFSHPDESGVYHADAGRGVDIYFFGVPPVSRLPLRAYHAGMFFKNGVPAGYVEVLSFFERAEVGFNLYYTFREGESAWLYARLLRLFHQVLGVTCFSVDPYQIGLETPRRSNRAHSGSTVNWAFVPQPRPWLNWWRARNSACEKPPAIGAPSEPWSDWRTAICCMKCRARSRAIGTAFGFGLWRSGCRASRASRTKSRRRSAADPRPASYDGCRAIASFASYV